MRHVYLHVPFCARRCSYCDFAIAIRKSIPADRYVATIRRELELRRAAGDWDDDPIETLYLGGGTPSLLPAPAIRALVQMFEPPNRRSADPPSEITLEANPDDITAEAARAWVSAGVNRLSVGVQSFDDAVLTWMHRTHDAAAVPRAVRAAREAGIGSLSLDLIFGLPPELDAPFAGTLAAALALEPDHLSVYGLSVESRTPLARWISRGATGVPSDDRYAEEFLLAHDTLANAGYQHYEVSNYARPGRRSRHNSAYWLARSCAGLGPAAHSFRSGVRRWNLREWAAYERAVAGGADPVEQREQLTAEQQRLEQLYLGLRTDRGLERASWWQVTPEREAAWKDRGWLVQVADRYHLTPSGWLYLDEVVASLTTSTEGG